MKIIFFFVFLCNGTPVAENRSTWVKICPNVTSSTTNPTCTEPGSNSGLCGERPATNRLSHGTALLVFYCRPEPEVPHTHLIPRTTVLWACTIRGCDSGSGKSLFSFPTRLDCLWGPSTFLFNGYRDFFLGVKRPGLDGDHSPPSSAGVKNG
jgi:hypothetical protein